MIIILSPSKTIKQNFKSDISIFSDPLFIEEATDLVKLLKKYNVDELSDILKASLKLSQVTYDRYQFWNSDHSIHNSKQALLSFQGDVYTGLDSHTLKEKELMFAQDHLIILSGLYGLLKPLDLMQPYRLEISARLKGTRYDNLYKFWYKKITNKLNEVVESSKQKVLLNLASNEYFKAIDVKNFKFPIITPIFKEEKNGDFKVISIYAKRARGLMTRYILNNQITDPDEIKSFSEEGYYYNVKLSTKNGPVFTR